MRLFIFVILTVFFISCAPIHVSHDYEKTTNFNTYKTYQYYADINTGLGELDTNRLLDAIDAKMKSLGYTISETPDFYIDIKSNITQEQQKSSFSVGMGGSGSHVGGGVSMGIPVGQGNLSYRVIIDFVSQDKNQLFWEAISTFSFNPNQTPESREATFKKLADKVWYQYPPEG